MTTVFHGRTYDGFIEIQSNLRRKKLHRTNKDSNFNKFQKATSCPSPQCLVDQNPIQKPILVVATDQITDHT